MADANYMARRKSIVLISMVAGYEIREDDVRILASAFVFQHQVKSCPPACGDFLSAAEARLDFEN